MNETPKNIDAQIGEAKSKILDYGREFPVDQEIVGQVLDLAFNNLREKMGEGLNKKGEVENRNFEIQYLAVLESIIAMTPVFVEQNHKLDIAADIFHELGINPDSVQNGTDNTATEVLLGKISNPHLMKVYYGEDAKPFLLCTTVLDSEQKAVQLVGAQFTSVQVVAQSFWTAVTNKLMEAKYGEGNEYHMNLFNLATISGTGDLLGIIGEEKSKVKVFDLITKMVNVVKTLRVVAGTKIQTLDEQNTPILCLISKERENFVFKIITTIVPTMNAILKNKMHRFELIFQKPRGEAINEKDVEHNLKVLATLQNWVIEYLK